MVEEEEQPAAPPPHQQPHDSQEEDDHRRITTGQHEEEEDDRDDDDDRWRNNTRLNASCLNARLGNAWRNPTTTNEKNKAGARAQQKNPTIIT